MSSGLIPSTQRRRGNSHQSSCVLWMVMCHLPCAMGWISSPTAPLSTSSSFWTAQQHQPSAQIHGHHPSALFSSTRKRLDKTKRYRGDRPPSRVQDPDGPTPDATTNDFEVVDTESLEGLREITEPDDLPRPIPHQPWRRGEMDGCDAPIDTPWRRQAEEIIHQSAQLVGGKVIDVTWFLTQVVVTLDEAAISHAHYGELADRDLSKATGPEIDIVEPRDPLYYDPNDPEPEEIWDDEEEFLYQRQTEEEQEASRIRKHNSYAAKDEDDPVDEPHDPNDAIPDNDVPLYMNEESRAEIAYRATVEEQARAEDLEKPVDVESIHKIDTMTLSTIAGAILEALEEYEDEINILSRHELILTSPGASDVLETQRQFNAHRGFDIIVETQDPFESNRTLKGQLVDRNSMDLIINQKGRMVTIPLVFVKCVRIPPTKARE